MKVSKYLIALAILFFMIASAHATVSATADTNAGVRFAKPGQDLNLLVTSIDSDKNSYYYFARMWVPDLNTYWDFNVNDGNLLAASETIKTGVYVTAGSCAGFGFSTGAINVIDVNDTYSLFDVKLALPSTAPKNKEVLIQTWKALVTGIGTTATCIPDGNGVAGSYADANFLVAPYLRINMGTPVVQADSNVLIQGYGFSADANIGFKFFDSNGTYTDLNTILDVNYDTPWVTSDGNVVNLRDQQLADRDVNGFNLKFRILAPRADYNALWINADKNGNFDVNIVVPASIVSLAAIGKTDANIWAVDRLSNSSNDANSMLVVTPKIQISLDTNITVLICDKDVNQASARTCYQGDSRASTKDRMPLTDAINKKYIENIQAVKGIIVQFGGSLDGNASRIIVVKMNADINMAKAANRNYTLNGISNSHNDFNIYTANLPEYQGIDANVYWYYVRSGSNMPALIRNHKKCPSDICTNTDGTTLSENYTDKTGAATWAYNSATGDGNMMFRVVTFSAYSFSTLDGNVNVSANQAFRSRWTGMKQTDSDNNISFTFSYRDTNEADLNGGIRAYVYLSKNQGDANSLMLYSDTNITDTWGIGLGNSNYSKGVIACTDSDANLSTANTCTVDLNIENVLGGMYYIDVNLVQRDENSLVISSPLVRINPPDVNIVDINFTFGKRNIGNDVNITYDGGYASADANQDINITIDFNVHIPDRNSLQDMNIVVWLSSTGTSRDINRIAWDVNALNAYVNFQWFLESGINKGFRGGNLRCSQYRTNENYSGAKQDVNCSVDFNAANLPAARYFIIVDINRTNVTSNVADFNKVLGGRTDDINRLGDWNKSPTSIIINDSTNPTVQINAPAPGTSVNNQTVTIDFNGSDVASGVEKYWLSEDNATWVETPNKAYTFVYTDIPVGTKVYYVKSQDYSDINSAVTSVSVNFVTGGSTSSSSSSSSSSSTTGTTSSGTTSEQSTQTITQGSTTVSSTPESVQTTLSAAGITSETALATAANASTRVSVERSLDVQKTSGGGSATTYVATLSTTITNNSGKDWKNVRVVEVVPKSVAQTAAKIVNANYDFTVLVDDPVLEFSVPEVLAGQSATITYDVKSNLSKAVLEDYGAPAITSVTESVPAKPPVRRPTTTEEPAMEQPTAPAMPEPTAPDNSGLLAGVAIVVIVIVGGYLYSKGKGKKKITQNSAIRK